MLWKFAAIIPKSKNRTQRNPAVPLLAPCCLVIALQNILFVLYPLMSPARIKRKALRFLFRNILSGPA